jgi:O-acetyl-ADP-ribose deacetylase (regulator of RNase III)
MKVIKGDLLTAKGIIAHGVNCVGGFGSGIAGQIAKQYPMVREFYLDKHNNGGWQLGDIQIVTVSPDKIIVNCATQNEFLPRDQVHVDYPAIKLCLIQLNVLSRVLDLPINLPRIGCGLAGGNWQTVKDIIETFDHENAHLPVTVYEL